MAEYKHGALGNVNAAGTKVAEKSKPYDAVLCEQRLSAASGSGRGPATYTK